MDPILWWIVFLCLIVLITVLSLYLCYSVGESCFNKPATRKLSKYRFAKTDVEDLTNIGTNSAWKNNKIEFVDLGYVKKEKTFEFGSDYSILDIMHEIGEEKKTSARLPVVTEGMRRNSSASVLRKFSLKPESVDESTDTLDCVDPVNVEILRSIAQIEDQAHKVEHEITVFLGNEKNLKFFEINERLIRLSLALSDVECISDELRKRKKEVQKYINECKTKINSKVT